MSDQARDEHGRFQPELDMNQRIRRQLGLLPAEPADRVQDAPESASEAATPGGFDGGQAASVTGAGGAPRPEPDMNELVRNAVAAKFFGRGFGD